jgi:hypothetical protein
VRTGKRKIEDGRQAFAQALGELSGITSGPARSTSVLDFLLGIFVPALKPRIFAFYRGNRLGSTALGAPTRATHGENSLANMPGGARSRAAPHPGGSSSGSHFAERPYVPVFAVALRLGLPRSESIGVVSSGAGRRRARRSARISLVVPE